MTAEKVPPCTTTCRVAGCPDLVEGENLAGRTCRVCRAAGNKIPGNLSECPTGYLEQVHLTKEEIESMTEGGF
ncbi:MAG: hypothetical protein WC277_08530 [Bacilli bacterium]